MILYFLEFSDSRTLVQKIMKKEEKKKNTSLESTFKLTHFDFSSQSHDY